MLDDLRSRLFTVGFIAAQVQRPPEMPTIDSICGLSSRIRKSSLWTNMFPFPSSGCSQALRPSTCIYHSHDHGFPEWASLGNKESYDLQVSEHRPHSAPSPREEYCPPFVKIMGPPLAQAYRGSTANRGWAGICPKTSPLIYVSATPSPLRLSIL